MDTERRHVPPRARLHGAARVVRQPCTGAYHKVALYTAFVQQRNNFS